MKMGPNARNYFGYGNPQPADSFGLSPPSLNTGHNETHLAQPSSQSNTWNYHSYGNPLPVGSFGSRQHNFISTLHERDHSNRVYNNVSAEVNDNNIDERSSSNLERSKLIRRIKKYFQDLAPLTFSENWKLFDNNDWVPKWDLGSVKRHVKRLHREIKENQEKEDDANNVRLSSINKEDIENILPPGEISDFEKIEIGKIEPPKVAKKSPPDDRVGPVHDKSKLLVGKGKPSDHEAVETSDETSDFQSDLSSKLISDSASHLNTDKNKRIIKNKQKSSVCKSQRKPSGFKRQKLEESSSTSESERDSPDTPDWRKPGVVFGWVKLTTTSRLQPAFIFPKRDNASRLMGQYIQAKGTLSDFIHPIEVIATPAEVELAKKSKKSYTHINAIKKFNALNNTNF